MTRYLMACAAALVLVALFGAAFVAFDRVLGVWR